MDNPLATSLTIQAGISRVMAEHTCIQSVTRFWWLLPWNSENKPRGLYFSMALFERLIFWGAYIRRGLSTAGNLRSKINWASLIVWRKFTVFALFYCVFEGIPSTRPPGGGEGGAYIWRGDWTEGFCVTSFRGLIFGGAYRWRGVFSEFYGTFLFCLIVNKCSLLNTA